jgi:hypothetical protein
MFIYIGPIVVCDPGHYTTIILVWNEGFYMAITIVCTGGPYVAIILDWDKGLYTATVMDFGGSCIAIRMGCHILYVQVL